MPLLVEPVLIEELLEVCIEKFVFVRSPVLVTTDRQRSVCEVFHRIAFLDTNQLRLEQAITAVISSITLSHFFYKSVYCFFFILITTCPKTSILRKRYSTENIYVIPKHVR